jgi:hypothetical protein
MNLISVIEQFDPGHFSRRLDSLQRLSDKVVELGFFPLPISGKDLECYWIRIQSIEEGKYRTITYETYDEILSTRTGILESLKKVARYETR